MTIFNVLQSRQWVIGRRLVLIGIIVFLGIRSYGDSLMGWFEGANVERDIVITQSEFRPDLPGAKPAWIITLRNDSRWFTYDDIQVEAIYFDDNGTELERDRLTLAPPVAPGEEKLIGSVDFKERPGAVSGRLRVLGAAEQ